MKTKEFENKFIEIYDHSLLAQSARREHYVFLQDSAALLLVSLFCRRLIPIFPKTLSQDFGEINVACG